jgi:carbonic anhydrase
LFSNGQKFTGEIHFVHANSASTQYAALGVFMQTGPSNSSAHDESNSRRKRRKRRTRRDTTNTDNTNNSTLDEWNNYFNVADQLVQVNNTVVVSLQLGNLMGSNLDNFYRYPGSLTTPPCSEFVLWTVFKTPIIFTEPVIDAFRSHIYFEDYRGPQPINNRTVYRNFVNDTPSPILDYQCCTQIVQDPGTRNDSSNGNSILYNNKQLLSYFYVFSLVFYIKNFIF